MESSKAFLNDTTQKILVYFEAHNDVEEAILREKRIKKWNRQWKINLIEKKNPNWDDIYQTLI